MEGIEFLPIENKKIRTEKLEEQVAEMLFNETLKEMELQELKATITTLESKINGGV